MTKIDYLWDPSGLLAKKVALAAAVVILTYYPVVEDDYSAGHVICAALVDKEWKKQSLLNVENDHIFLFLSVGWIRSYLKKHNSVSFQRTVKGVDRVEEHSIFPYSIKFELASCHREKFATEAKTAAAVRKLSGAILLEYKKKHVLSPVLDTASKIILNPDVVIPPTAVEVIVEDVIVENMIVDGNVLGEKKQRKKVGRKRSTDAQMKLLIKSLKMSNQRHRKRKKLLLYKFSLSSKSRGKVSCEQSETELKCDIISEMLLGACTRAGVLKTNVNNQKQLTIEAGVIIRSLHSDCNVSFSKMPLTLHFCLSLLFGSLNEKTLGFLIQSSSTYAEAAVVSSHCVALQTKMLFTDRCSNNRIVAAHLSMDESEKKRDALVVKLIQYRDGNNRTRSTALMAVPLKKRQ